MKRFWKPLLLLTWGMFGLNSCEDVPEPYPIPGGIGSGSQDDTSAYIDESFASSLGTFTSLSASGELTWTNDYSSAMITGYKDFDGDGQKENKSGVTYLVSAPINLTASQAAYVTFNHAINYSKTTLVEDHKLVISKNYSGNVNTATWEELPISTEGTGSSFDFVSSGQVAIPAAYIGQPNVVVALKHIAHEDYSSTWEVKNFKVVEGVAQNTPEPPSLPDGTYLEESFASSLGVFTSLNASGELSWINDYSSAMITGFKDFDGDGQKENKPGVTYLVSAPVDLTASQAAYVTFDHAINYSKTTLVEDHKLVISKDFSGDVNTATWEELPLSTNGTGTSFTFVNVGKIAIPATYIGQPNVVVALKHIAHEDYSSTWEVKNFKMAEGDAESEEPETPSGDYDVTLTMASLGLGNAEELGTYTLADGAITLTFAQEEGSNAPKYYTSYTAARMYAKNSVTITSTTAIDEVVLHCTDPSGSTLYNGNTLLYGDAAGNTLSPLRPDNTTVRFEGVNSTTLKVVNEHTAASAGVQLRIVSIDIRYAQ